MFGVRRVVCHLGYIMIGIAVHPCLEQTDSRAGLGVVVQNETNEINLTPCPTSQTNKTVTLCSPLLRSVCVFLRIPSLYLYLCFPVSCVPIFASGCRTKYLDLIEVHVMTVTGSRGMGAVRDVLGILG